jgi:protein farnesyltransferase/geranylgeranyltransferase type-1 subunit alpha
LKKILRTITHGLTGKLIPRLHQHKIRQWVVETYKLWDDDLKFVEKLLLKDIRNNSAWNERRFILTQNNKTKFTKESIESEMKFVLDMVKRSPNNESPWVYLKG